MLTSAHMPLPLYHFCIYNNNKFRIDTDVYTLRSNKMNYLITTTQKYFSVCNKDVERVEG